MVFVFNEKRPLENGGCSLGTLPPKCKRPKVFAVRHFPSQCGSTAAQINMQIAEVESCGLKLDEPCKDIGFIEKHRDNHFLEGKVHLEKIVEPQSSDFSFCSNISEKATLCLTSSKNVEHGNEDLPMLPVGQGSNDLREELIFEKPKLSQDLGRMKESMVVHEGHDQSQELSYVRVGSPIASKITIIPGLEEAGDDMQSEEGSSMEIKVIPNHPVSSAIVCKEDKYITRRRVAAARDFPHGCGHNVQKLSEAVEKCLGQRKADVNFHKEVSSVNQVDGNFEAEHSSRTKMKQQVVFGKTGDDLEGRSGSDSFGCPEVVQRPQFEILAEIKRKKRLCEAKGEQDENLKIGGECDVEVEKNKGDSVDEEVKDLAKDENNRKRFIGVPSLDVEKQGTSTCVQNETNKVLVLGLTAAAYCPRKDKRTVKSGSSVSTVTRSKRKKLDHDRQDQCECVLNESTKNVEKSEEGSKMVVPYLKDSEAKEVTGNSCGGDSSENEDLFNDFQLISKSTMDVTLLPCNAGSSGERSVRSNVREILRLFQAVVRKLLQGEETKTKDEMLMDPENASKRIDFRAANILKMHGKCVNTGKKGIVGPVPGVEVGDFFNYRMELSIIGLHRPPQAGIDYLKQGDKIIATSIVASGGYANDVDSSDVLIYTGQGGSPKSGNKQHEDQKLERGNLALKNSIDEKNVVRVIRGFKETKPSDASDGKSKTVATYTYDGLYTVEKYWPDVSPHGKLVYRFELRRISGQPELAWKEVKRSKRFEVREGRCVDDISGGKEKLPICAVNTIDDEKPPPFTYITSMMYPDWCQPIPPRGCDCKDGCSDSEHCACAVKNEGEIPYNHDGAIVEAKSLVHECGSSCKCPPTCPNRVSQCGIKFPLEIFKTESRGWGVRSLSFIPSGSFICEYIGELLDDREAEQRVGSDEYLFDIGQNFNDTPLWNGLSALMPDVTSSSSNLVENIGFTIDAANYGNIGRFINHSCSPNLYAQNVLFDHDDTRIPHVMLFAAENIPPLQELSYHYNYTIDQVFDSNGNVKKKNCYCGSSECTGRMY